MMCVSVLRERKREKKDPGLVDWLCFLVGTQQHPQMNAKRLLEKEGLWGKMRPPK